MATCKIVRRNIAMKIRSSEIRSAKDRKPMFGRSISEVSEPAQNSSYRKKDHTTNCWNNLAKSPVALPREENRGPLRTLYSALYPTKPAIIPAGSSGKITSGAFNNTIKRVFGPCNNKESSDDGSVSQRSAAATFETNRRLLKSSHGFRFSPNRRFGSSASSSCCSLFQRHDDRRRASTFKRTSKSGFMERAYNIQPSNDAASGFHSISNLSSSLATMRNQNLSSALGSMAKAAQVSSMIQQDLMPIDKSVRERISLKSPSVKAAQNEPKNPDPMCGWHHPPSPDLLARRCSERPAERRTVSSLADKAQDGRMPTVNRKRKLEMQCKPMAETQCVAQKSSTVTAGPPSKRLKITQQQPEQKIAPVTVHERGVKSDCGSSRHLTTLTARRVTNIDQQPIRRFSLRRPPIAKPTEIRTPAPGPAAENMIQQHNKSNNSNSPRTLNSRTFGHYQSRYNPFNFQFNGKPY